MSLSILSKRLHKEDLPTFGLPMVIRVRDPSFASEGAATEEAEKAKAL